MPAASTSTRAQTTLRPSPSRGPAVGAGQLRDQVQAEAAEGGVAVDGRYRRELPRGVADLEQPPGAGRGRHSPAPARDRAAARCSPAPRPPAAGGRCRRRRRGPAARARAAARAAACAWPGVRRASSARHARGHVRGSPPRPRPGRPQGLAHEPSSGNGADRRRRCTSGTEAVAAAAAASSAVQGRMRSATSPYRTLPTRNQEPESARPTGRARTGPAAHGPVDAGAGAS